MSMQRNGEDLAAATTKVGPKGQIVIPKEIRAMFDIAPGDTVLVLADRERGIAVTPVRGNEAVFGQLFGGVAAGGAATPPCDARAGQAGGAEASQP